MSEMLMPPDTENEDPHWVSSPDFKGQLCTKCCAATPN